jgi:alcohol dehydrogenase (NADP+)
MRNAKAYSAASATSPLAPTTIARREPTEHDVQIEILFCGICHSDLHQVRNEWSGVMPTVYPVVPGHEIVGRVTKVGPAVTKYEPGDLAAQSPGERIEYIRRYDTRPYFGGLRREPVHRRHPRRL